MQASGTITWSGWAALAVLTATSAPAQEKKAPTGNGIDAATVAAYEKLGGVYGAWPKRDVGRIFLIGPRLVEVGLPGFYFGALPKAKLPHVPVPFGVDFSSGDLTDAGLKELAHLKNLMVLDLRDTKVTDAGLKELAPLTRLVSLGLSDTKVTDGGLKELAPLKFLDSLYLPSQVTDAGLKGLAPLKNLGKLSLGGTQVTNAGMKELALFKYLATLNLAGTKVTDAGLKELAPLQNLTELFLFDTPNVTTAGITNLQKSLPKCKISR